MIHRITFYKSVYKKFGIRAILFLMISKFKKDSCAGIRIKGVASPITLSNYTSDVTTLFQIFFAGEYNIKFKSTPAFIIDCGANIGLSALYLANKFPSAKIIAIEPDLNNFNFLKKNTAFYPNVCCLQKAIWPYSTKMEMIDPGRGNWGLQTKVSPNENENTIDAITIDEIISSWNINKIDLLKIDIEGAEKELFSNNYENWLSKTEVLAIELHDFFDPSISPVFNKAIAPYHFRKYYLGENLVCEKVTG